MRTEFKSKARKAAIAAVISALAVGGATVATTTTASAGVTGCAAGGSRQETGALIGAVIGGVIGNNVAKNERGLGTVAGAGLGAAAGSAIGCEQQKARAYGYTGRNAYIAHTNLNVRAAPSTSSPRVGGLGAGQRFQSLGASSDGRWVIVGQNGRQVGYVARGYVSPV